MARKLKIMENEKHPLDDLKNDEITKKREKRKSSGHGPQDVCRANHIRDRNTEQGVYGNAGGCGGEGQTNAGDQTPVYPDKGISDRKSDAP